MATRIIGTLHATLSDGRDVVQGQTVDLTAEDEASLESQAGGLVPSNFSSFAEWHEFKQDAYRSGRGDAASAAKLAEARAGQTFDLSEVPELTGDPVVGDAIVWLRKETPTVAETVAAAGDDPAKAAALLEAENAVSGGDPRAGVVKGLSAIINAGE